MNCKFLRLRITIKWVIKKDGSVRDTPERGILFDAYSSGGLLLNSLWFIIHNSKPNIHDFESKTMDKEKYYMMW